VRGGIGDKNSNLACVGVGGGRGGGGEGGRGTPFEVEEVVQGVGHGFGTVAPAFGCHAVDVVGDGGQVGGKGEDPRHVGRVLEMEGGKDGRDGLGEVMESYEAIKIATSRIACVDIQGQKRRERKDDP